MSVVVALDKCLHREWAQSSNASGEDESRSPSHTRREGRPDHEASCSSNRPNPAIWRRTNQSGGRENYRAQPGAPEPKIWTSVFHVMYRLPEWQPIHHGRIPALSAEPQYSLRATGDGRVGWCRWFEAVSQSMNHSAARLRRLGAPPG